MHLFSYLTEIDLNNLADVANCFDLLEKLFVENSSIAQTANELSQMDAEDLDIAQKNFRIILKISRNFKYGKYIPANHWFHLTPQNLGDDWIIWALASFHENGYIRERALKNLIGFQENIVLPFLFLRLIDWVEPIRELASSELIKRLDIHNSIVISRQVPFWAKIKHSIKISKKIFDILENYLKKDPIVQEFLLKKFENSTKKIKRAFFPYLVEGVTVEHSDFILRCFNDNDVKIKILALQLYRKYILTQSLAARFYEAMILNPFMPIRRESLFLEIDWKLQKSELVWKKALMDPHSSIRELAQFHLREMGMSQEAPAIYRFKICEGNSSIKCLQTAILGLGETGTSEDISIIVSFLNNPSTGIVHASMRSLYRLGAEVELQLCIYDLLESSSRKISREASKILSKKSSWQELDKLIEIFRKKSEVHIKRHIIYISDYFKKWEKIYFLLISLESYNENLIELTINKIRKWVNEYNRVMTLPNIIQSSALMDLLLKYKDVLISKKIELGIGQNNLFEVLQNFLNFTP